MHERRKSNSQAPGAGAKKAGEFIKIIFLIIIPIAISTQFINFCCDRTYQDGRSIFSYIYTNLAPDTIGLPAFSVHVVIYCGLITADYNTDPFNRATHYVIFSPAIFPLSLSLFECEGKVTGYNHRELYNTFGFEQLQEV